MRINSRREFLKAGLLAGGALALGGTTPLRALEPFDRRGGPRLLLSLAAYSFRDYFKDVDHERGSKTDPARRIDLFQFLDFCAGHGCDGAELTSYYFPADLTDEFLLKVKRHAFLRGVAISGSAVGNNFTLPAGEKRDREIARVKKWIDRAALLGAPHLRVFAGPLPSDMPRGQSVSLCIGALEDCCDHAAGRGVFLGLENHGGIVAEPSGLLEIVRAVKSPWIGINLDTGNFHTDDPYADLEKCAPYAVNVQLKAEISRRGAHPEPADLARLVQILRHASYQGYVALEYESKDDPWTAVPPLLKRLQPLMAS